MKLKIRKSVSVILVFAVLVSILTTGIINTHAYSTPPNYICLPEYTPSDGVETRTVLFAMPDSWTNSTWGQYGCNAGLYWWGSCTDNPDTYPSAQGHGWPGWKMKKDDSIPNLYSSLAPKDAPNMIFSNYIDSGSDSTYPEYSASQQTKDLQVEFFGQGDIDYYPLEFWDYVYDNYYDSFCNNPNYQIEEFGDYAKNFFYDEDFDSIFHYMDNMVYVVDFDTSRMAISPVSGKGGFDGAFYFYYGNGEFGIWPTKEICIEKEGIKLNNDNKVDS